MMMESDSLSSNRPHPWLLCLLLIVLMEGTVSLPVLKYPRAIYSEPQHRKTNRVDLPSTKPVSDLIFQDDVVSGTRDRDGNAPLIDIYNDRIFFREPDTGPKDVFGYIRSFPSTSTPLPRTVANRRFAQEPSTPSPLDASHQSPSNPDQEEGASWTEDILNIGSGEGMERIPLAWLQDWAARNNYTTTKTRTLSEDGRAVEEREELEVAFQSLFQVPSHKRPHPPCPPNQRRNHHGKCVKPVRIRLRILEESRSS